MLVAARIVAAVVALLHVQFLVVEMFLWEKPFGLRAFRQSAEQAARTALLAKNQGLYNGILAAGIVWGLVLSLQGAPHARQVLSFFLGAVVVAGLYGGTTVSKNIFVVQAAPAALALVLLWSAK